MQLVYRELPTGGRLGAPEGTADSGQRPPVARLGTPSAAPSGLLSVAFARGSPPGVARAPARRLGTSASRDKAR